MPLELAETIRTLRLEHRLCYEDTMYSLCESDPDHGQCFGYGKVLVEVSQVVIKKTVWKSWRS